MKEIWLPNLYELTNLLAFRCCPICHRRLLKSENCVCVSCLNRLTRLTHKPSNFHPIFEQTFYWQRTFVAATCQYYFTDNMRILVHQFKYYHDGRMAVWLGCQAALELLHTGFFDGIQYLIPVPLHWKRQMLRSYNQSEKIARGIQRVTKIPIRTGILKRCKNNPTQTHLRREERVENVRGIFGLTKNKDTLRSKHILLIDDVLTTGATLNECLEVLSQIEGIKISIFALCYASDTPILHYNENRDFPHVFIMNGPPEQH